MPTERVAARGAAGADDWVRDARSYAVAWGLPSGVFLAAALAPAPARTALWVACLAWMGVACLANARRCGRVHCHFTGPFFLLMALAIALDAGGVLALGAQGWRWLGVLTVLGAAALWVASERRWGVYRARR
ncbi:MAG: hypothetical protein R3286_06375 [Gammaproteobacteria bacterium]|nr:hypothetical protein [Gammaproteobacteria bacterium]